MGYPGICFLKSDFPGTPFHRGRDIVILSIRFLSLVGLEDEGCDVVDWVCISNPRKHFGIDHTRGKRNHTRGNQITHTVENSHSITQAVEKSHSANQVNGGKKMARHLP
jgi:hypothetical protein